MKTKFTTCVAALVAAAGAANAGTLERSSLPIDLMFDRGNVLQFSAVSPRPDLSAAPFGSEGSVFNDFTMLGFAYKTDINEKLSFGLFVNQPFGADNGYATGPVAGYSIDLESNEMAAVVSYQYTDRLSLHGGARIVKTEMDLSVPPAGGYTLSTGSDTGFGYLLGVSYAVPERGARVTLTYNSAVKHSFDSTEFGSTAFGQTNMELPQSLKLDAEMALNSKTLLFGSVKWSDYSAFEVAAPGFATLVVPGASVINYQEDNLVASLGMGRSLNDEWSVFGILEMQKADGEQTELRPYNGSKAVTLGAIYESGQYKVTAGAQYRQFGDATVSGQTFSDNTAVSPFLTVAYSF